MQISSAPSVLITGTVLVAVTIVLASAFVKNERSVAASADQREWLPSIQKIQSQLTASGYRDIEKFERNRNEYEVQAIDSNGERVNLFLSRLTGAVFDKLPQGMQAKNDHGAGSGLR